MKFYMSYWSGGYQNKPSEYVVDLHKLSAHLILKNYGEVHMITDSNSIDSFKDIKFTTITTDLDSLPQHNYNWALGKIQAYRIIAEKNEPFLHLDYDVFIWEKLPENFLKNEVFVQEQEHDIHALYNIEQLRINLKNNYILDFNIDKSYNMGIFGGNNTEFIKKYAESSYNFSTDEENRIAFQYQNNSCHFCVATTCEQYYLYQASKYWNIPVSVLFADESHLSQQGSSCLTIDNNKCYTHLIGYKNDPSTKVKVYKKLKSFKLI